jgi:hypothetical protein
MASEDCCCEFLVSYLHNSNQGYEKTIEGETLEVTWVCLGVFTLEESGLKPQKKPLGC